MTGRGFLRALDDRGFQSDPKLQEILDCRVGQSNFYLDLARLGEHHFKGSRIREETGVGLNIMVNYHVYSNINAAASSVAATSGLLTSLRVRRWITACTISKRKAVCWSEGAVPDWTHMQLDFNNSGLTRLHTDKTLSKALNLSERGVSNWSAQDRDVVITHMKHASGASKHDRHNSRAGMC